MHPLTSADPRQIAAYRLSGVLGKGGQGAVYLGEDGAGTKVAVKVLHTLTADAHRRFLREAEAARRVAPFCTARVLDVGIAEDQPYLVSEFITGPSLEQLVRDEGARQGSGLDRLAVATLTALAAIHRAGIVHRDFKPANVIMGPEGPVVIDFGIARALDQTATSSVMGTPAFMAPEQFEGRVLGPEVDLFSWASTMVYVATGRQAFKGETMPALMHAILTQAPDLSGVPDGLRPLLETCLNKDPAARPRAEELLARLTGQAGGAVGGTLLLPPEPPGRAAPRRAGPRRGAAIGALIFSVLLALLLLGQGADSFVGVMNGGYRKFLHSAEWNVVTQVAMLAAVPWVCAAVWRRNMNAAIRLAMLVPLGLVQLVWMLALHAGPDLPQVLLSAVPTVLGGALISLVRPVKGAVAWLGNAGGGLLVIQGLLQLAYEIWGLDDSFRRLMITESWLARFVVGVWLAVVAVRLARRTERSRTLLDARLQ